MNFIMYLIRILRGNDLNYWYDLDKNHVYIPNNDFILKITIDDMRRIITDRKLKHWTTNEIFEIEKLSENVNFWTLNYWVKEYEKGLMNEMILWIAYNDLGLSTEDIF